MRDNRIAQPFSPTDEIEKMSVRRLPNAINVHCMTTVACLVVSLSLSTYSPAQATTGDGVPTPSADLTEMWPQGTATDGHIRMTVYQVTTPARQRTKRMIGSLVIMPHTDLYGSNGTSSSNGNGI